MMRVHAMKTGSTGFAIAACLTVATVTTSVNADTDFVGQIVSNGTSTLGSGLTAINVTDSVMSYRRGEAITTGTSGKAVIRLDDNRGSIYLTPGTTATVDVVKDQIVVSAEGSGLRFLFPENASFKVTFDCFDVTPASSTGERAATLWHDGGATYLRSVSQNFNVQVVSAESVRVNDGEEMKGCQKGAAPLKVATTPANSTGDLSQWIIGAGAAVVGAIGSGSGAAAVGKSSDADASAAGKTASPEPVKSSVSGAATDTAAAPKPAASAKPETGDTAGSDKPKPAVVAITPTIPAKGVEPEKPQNGKGTSVVPVDSGKGVMTPADPTTKPASPIGKGKG